MIRPGGNRLDPTTAAVPPSAHVVAQPGHSTQPANALAVEPEQPLCQPLASLNELGDGELLTIFLRHKQETVFGELLRRHAPLVVGVIHGIVRDQATRDDCFQAVFLVMLSAGRRIRNRSSLSSWLHGVALRTARHANRLRMRQKSLPREAVHMPAASADPLAAIEAAHQRELLDEEVQRLPQPLREAVVLFDLEGLSQQQIADRLGLTVAAVEGRVRRGRKQLKLQLLRRGLGVSAFLLAVQSLSPPVHAAAPPSLTVSAITLARAGSLKAVTLGVGTSALLIELLRGEATMKLGSLATGLVAAAALLTVASVPLVYSGGPPVSSENAIAAAKVDTSLALPADSSEPVTLAFQPMDKAFGGNAPAGNSSIDSVPPADPAATPNLPFFTALDVARFQLLEMKLELAEEQERRGDDHPSVKSLMRMVEVMEEAIVQMTPPPAPETTLPAADPAAIPNLPSTSIQFPTALEAAKFKLVEMKLELGELQDKYLHDHPVVRSKIRQMELLDAAIVQMTPPPAPETTLPATDPAAIPNLPSTSIQFPTALEAVKFKLMEMSVELDELRVQFGSGHPLFESKERQMQGWKEVLHQMSLQTTPDTSLPAADPAASAKVPSTSMQFPTALEAAKFKLMEMKVELGELRAQFGSGHPSLESKERQLEVWEALVLQMSPPPADPLPAKMP